MKWLFGEPRQERSAVASRKWPLDRVLTWWTKDEPFTLDMATRGVQVFGATGSGKSSGSGRALALSYLSHGFGGIVLCAKNGEAAQWHDYCRTVGRENDLIIFHPLAPYRFSFLDYELHRPGAGAGQTEIILQLLMTLAEISNRGSGASGGGRDDEGYWKRSLQQLLRNVIDLCVIATGKVSVPDLYRIVISSPATVAQCDDPAWQAKSFCWQCLQRADAATKSGYQAHDFSLVADYLLLEFPSLSEKTRSIIVSTFTSMIDVFNRGSLRELFCETTNVTPDDALAGKVIVVDLPVKEFAEVGQLAAVVWKYLFQRAVERRDLNANPRPCFLFADESQYFTTQFDAQFQTTARSSRCCTVYLTQNINNYLAAYKGPSGMADAKSLLGNLTTQIVHALADSDTAEYVANLIGRRKQLFQSGNVSHTPYHPIDDFFHRDSGHGSSGWSETMEFDVQPAELCRMRTGGKANNYMIDALVWRGGEPFASTGRSYLRTTFRQEV
jgi:hypothetical protein